MYFFFFGGGSMFLARSYGSGPWWTWHTRMMAAKRPHSP